MTRTQALQAARSYNAMIYRHNEARAKARRNMVITEVSIRVELASYNGEEQIRLSDEEVEHLPLDWLIDNDMSIDKDYPWIGQPTYYLRWGVPKHIPDTRMRRLKNRWRKWLINTFEPMPF